MPRSRARALVALAGVLDRDEIRLDRSADSLEARAALLAMRGIGPWTADIYLLFCKGDADAFAPGDLALQVGVQMLFELPARPTAARSMSMSR